MNNFCQKIRVLAILLILISGSVLADMIDSTSGDPASIVKQTTDNILEKLKIRRAEFEAQPELLREIVRLDLLPQIDLEYSARLILGKAGRDVTPQQLKEFSDALSHVLINRYSDGLLEFRSDKQLEIMPMKGQNTEKLSTVRTRIKLENGGSTPVDYRFHMTSTGWKVFDVSVEGISYVVTLTGQYRPPVEAQGIDKVTADILAGNLPPNE